MFSQEEPVGTKWMRSVTGVFATGEYSPCDFLPISSILHTKALSIPLRGGGVRDTGLSGRQWRNSPNTGRGPLGAFRRLVSRLKALWQRISEGFAIADLWTRFRAEARAARVDEIGEPWVAKPIMAITQLFHHPLLRRNDVCPARWRGLALVDLAVTKSVSI